MNHYTSGVILYGERELIRRQSLSKYINADDSCLYLVDPSRNSLEQEESDRAAKRFREYFKMRRTCHNKTDWVNVRLRGGVLTHPFQRDGSSCGVMVIMMAKAVMEAFPNKPEMTFLMTKKEMAQARRTFAQTILEASVFDSDTNCAMCATAKPPNPGPSITDWIQCDNCNCWFHSECLDMTNKQLSSAQKTEWKCVLCVT
ncbi:hypothetical protein ACER0C_019878 [Sarotherodon galilaeus]